MSSSFSSSTPGKPWQPPAPEDLAPELPQYEILGLLGRGGMGAVYHARQKSLKREVAIKLLPPSIEDADMSYGERFKAEAQVMARLNHPGIIAVYDAGETPGGLLYFVMEYVQGTDVHQMIASSGKLPPQHAHAITAHVCDALAYAHANGLIHRDIKPANIMVDTQGRVKVADFGLAKMANDDHGFTKSNMAVGTPDFVAPEALITGMPVDGRADLYAVGVMLYQMLTGQIPRGAWHPVSVVVPGTDRRFDDIIVKAMQYDREARHSSASELRQHLDTLLMPAVPAPDLQHYSSAGMAKSSPVAVQQEPPQPRAPAQPTKKPLPVESGAKNSKTGLWIGLGAAAALGVGAFVMLSGGKTAKQSSPPAPSSGTSTGTVPKLAPEPPPKPLISSPSSPPSTASAIAKAPAPVFPPGKWVKVFSNMEDFPEGLRNSKSGVTLEDGFFSASPAREVNVGIQSKGSQWGIRGILRRNKGNSKSLGALRFDGETPNLWERITILPQTGIPRIEQSLPSGQLSVGSELPAAVNIDADKMVKFEFASYGSRLFGRIDDSLLPVVKAHVANPMPVVSINHSIRDIEVINLDGIPEAEALKILGVDEKGNDLRSPTVASTPTATPPVSETKSPVTNPGALPPGQWVKLFTKLEDLPADLRQPDSGVKFEDGWIDLAASAKWLRFPSVLTGNYAVKARFRRKSSAQNQIVVRRQITGGTGMYMLRYFQGMMSCLSRDAGKNQETKLFDMPVKDGVSDGGEYILEFGVVGGKLIGRYDTQVVGFAQDALCPEGVAHIQGSAPIRDVEVINLDGLPEAEALRILGVDEKGNDLRALAAKQELQRAERAKEEDAIAAIPELKVLHDQFVKLQAERVTAPFEADVAKLNSGYLGGLDRKIADEKKAGHLDGVIALEAEKKLVQGVTTSTRQPSDTRLQDAAAPCPIPAEDDATPIETLKALRQIYRTAYAKLEEIRASNLKLLTTPLFVRLKKLEADLTKKNSITDALKVQGYRNGLNIAESSPAPAVVPTNSTSAPMAQATDKTGADRQAAELVLKHGGGVTIEQSGKRTDIKGMAQMPVKNFDLIKITLNAATTPSLKAFDDAQMKLLSGLEKMESLTLQDTFLSTSFLDVCASWPKFKELKVHIDNGMSPEPEGWEKLALLTKLETLDINTQKTLSAKARQIIISHPRLTSIDIVKDCDDAFVLQLSTMKQLRGLGIYIDPKILKASSISALAKLPNLERLFLRGPSDVAARLELDPIDFTGFRKLTRLAILYMVLSQNFVKSLEGVRPLTDELVLEGCILANDAVVRAVGLVECGQLALRGCTYPENYLSAMHPKSAVGTLVFAHQKDGKVLNDLLPTLAGIKSLNRLILPERGRLDVPIDPVKLAAFQKARPDVQIVEP
ncbi:MAG: serine/threonine protein kinase [Verrucomicrobiaceae bacterium]|nr:serine/threonine protein kinase [Verrucomicrobiaceae bacterium]